MRNLQDVTTMTTYTKQNNGVTTAISIERAADNRYISIQIRSTKGLDVLNGDHIWIPIDTFKELSENAIRKAEQSA